ncbi:Hypothetical predicted protein [Mytilus galloprovincialis]|uniref:Uncharacterized protein n=1 Tax=Mytilus galloprovincialis TaxID=29158 RepID=A0A8B6CQ66_MYTGA|nr:Hypothetical predicted protein [Mytilus galloprovincialis]
MFQNKIEGRARDVLLQKLYTLHSYGWRCILFSDQISNFDVSMWNFPIKRFTLYVNDVEKILQSKILFANSSLESFSEIDIFNTGIIQNISCHQFSLKHLYAYFISLTSSKQAQRVPFTVATINNKYQYKQYKSCLSSLLTNVYHDAVSGWLMIASLFCKTKQYRKALHIIRYSISKCTSNKLFFGLTLSDIHNQSFKLLPFNKKSVAYLLKILFVDFIRFKVNSTLTPDELVIEGWKQQYSIPSTAYAYFLSVLYHYHLNNVKQCQDSIQLVIGERYLMPYLKCIAEAYTLLGIALQLFGDKESARQAFLQSLAISPDETYNSAARRLL